MNPSQCQKKLVNSQKMRYIVCEGVAQRPMLYQSNAEHGTEGEEIANVTDEKNAQINGT